MYEKTFWKDNVLLVSGVERLDLNRTFACGQSFRWQRTERGWFGIAFGRGIYAETAEGVLRIFPCAKAAPEKNKIFTGRPIKKPGGGPDLKKT